MPYLPTERFYVPAGVFPLVGVYASQRPQQPALRVYVSDPKRPSLRYICPKDDERGRPLPLPRFPWHIGSTAALATLTRTPVRTSLDDAQTMQIPTSFTSRRPACCDTYPTLFVISS